MDFLAAGPRRGHAARLVDRDEFLETRLSKRTVVLAKSHYHDPAVQRHIIGSGVQVINDLSATDRCRSRLAIALRLRSSGLPTPAFLNPNGTEPPRRKGSSWISKPDGGGDHRLELVTDPAQVDLAHRFVQQFLTAERTMKVYVVGGGRTGVELISNVASGIDPDPRRRTIDFLDHAVEELAVRTGEALGLDIFNVDMVLHAGSWWIIDVNPFPRLEPVPDVANALWNLIEAQTSTLA